MRLQIIDKETGEEILGKYIIDPDDGMVYEDQGIYGTHYVERPDLTFKVINNKE